MQKLNEIEIAQSYIGKAYNREKISKVAKQSTENRYIADCHNYKDDLLDLFGITSALLDNWSCSGIELSIFINVQDTKIVSCGVDKCKYSCGGHGRPSVKVLQPTQQELRIFKRILEYVTI